jgi:hypothetical protein
MPIKRIWHGWATRGNADQYQKLLCEEVFPGIEAKKFSGLLGIELLRRDYDEEVEFILTLSFDSLKNVIDFQERDCPRCHVPEKALKMLKRWEQVPSHYEEVESRLYQ